MPERSLFLVPLFLVLQGIAVHWAASRELPPAAPDFRQFPVRFGAWSELREDFIAADVAAELRADRVLSRTYVHYPEGSAASLFVAWFQSQRAGASQPHSPQVCLPGAGWVPDGSSQMDIATRVGTIRVNRYLVAKGAERAVVLYWYQMGARTMGSEWAAKLWSIETAIAQRRTDIALARIVVFAQPGSYEKATADAIRVAREVYPLLRSSLP